MNIRKKKICIIGIGKAGSAFALELSDAGLNVKYIIDGDVKILKALSKKIKGSQYFDHVNIETISDSDIIILALRDDQLAEAAERICSAEITFKNKTFIHLSGSLTSDVLKNKKFSSSDIASFHPIQTFNKVSLKNNSLLNKIYFGIEGGKNASVILKKFASMLGSKYIVIPSSKKYIYHIASVFASNYLVVLADIVSELSGNVSGKKASSFELFEPIIINTLRNIKESGSVKALTGPVARNDIELVSRHLAALKKDKKEFLQAYSVLGKAAAELAFKKGSIKKIDKTKFKKLFDQFLHP